jgi:hypothetical protein
MITANKLNVANSALRTGKYNIAVTHYLEHFCLNLTSLRDIHFNLKLALKKYLKHTVFHSGKSLVFLCSEMELAKLNRITESYFKKNNLSFNEYSIINIDRVKDVSDQSNHLQINALQAGGMKTIQFTKTDSFISETILYVLENPTNELALLSYSEPAIFILLIYSLIYNPKVFVPSSDGSSLVETDFFNPMKDSPLFDLLKKNMEELTCLKKLFFLNFLKNSKVYDFDQPLKKNINSPVRYENSSTLNNNVKIPSDCDLSKYQVFFEEYKNGIFTGWAYHSSLSYNPAIDLKINDQIVVQNFKKWNSREDVSKHYQISENQFGFEIPYSFKKANQSLTMTLYLAGTNKFLGSGSLEISSNFLHILTLLDKVKEQREKKDFIELAKTNENLVKLRSSKNIFRINQKLIAKE